MRLGFSRTEVLAMSEVRFASLLSLVSPSPAKPSPTSNADGVRKVTSLRRKPSEQRMHPDGANASGERDVR